MKIDIKPILKVIELKDYDERMSPAQVFVWLNPPRAFLRKRDDLMQALSRKITTSVKKDGELETEGQQVKYEVFNAGMFAWYAELWSQCEDEDTHWTVDEITELNSADPALLSWLTRTSSQALNDHRTGEKKS